MKRALVFFALAIGACANVNVKDCRPSVSVDRIDSRNDGLVSENHCQFDIHNPTACLAMLWLKVKCPTE